GSASEDVTITIHGTNDVPVLGGETSGSVTEDVAVSGGDLSTSGDLTIADVDAGQSNFGASEQDGSYGHFSSDAAGHWTYTADNSQSAIQSLGAGETLTETFTVTSSDGSASEDVTITIHGTNDVPVIGGSHSGDVTEDVSNPLHSAGTLTIADADAGQSTFAAQAATAGSNGYGTFTLDAAGHWTYDAANGQAAIQALGAGATLTDSFTAVSSDGTNSEVVTVTIHGVNDVPVIGGSHLGDVTEDVSNPLHATGTLTIADADTGQSSFAAQAAAAGTYGTFTLDSAGHWTYDAANGQAAIQALGAGATLTDSFTAVSSDGSNSQLVTVTIHGINDIPTIGGTNTGSVTEDASNPLVTSGNLTITDADTGQSTFTAQAGTTGSNGYGTFTLDSAGHWDYSANNSLAAIQALNNGQTLTDSFTAWSSDGTGSRVVTVTINGVTDVVGDPDDHDDFVGTGSNTATTGVDTLWGTSGNDTISGLNGVDTIYGKAGDDTLNGNQQNDTLYGGSGNDTLNGNDQDDTLYGGSDNDTLNGNDNNDTLYGGLGIDNLSGGAGQDTLTGGSGVDTFTFSAIGDSDKDASKSDVITDFLHGTDKIDLSGIDANTSTGGNQAFAFGGNNVNTVANSVTWSESGGNTIIHIDNSGNTTADMQIVLTGTGLGLTSSDFIL
ncbi:MAG: M10 family metallopeptidase C-terminal domain-containing protein, partial [Proteobacteria bacterium]|nr:M10 family metallopeptidase C-terminal domain-containing protein [Pseudomonadota bacterium]